MILVTGANGVVGFPLCLRLASLGKEFKTISRTVKTLSNTIQWDLSKPANAQTLNAMSSASSLIHCAPIWLLPANLPALFDSGVRRIIAFSSSSVISKKDSKDTSENFLVKQLFEAETKLSEFCSTHDVALTIFRPSMIYGYSRDQNVTHLANFIRRFRFIVLAGSAHGLRQPVHADDLVDACFSVLDNQKTFAKTYVLAGADVLTYRMMAEKIFRAMNMQPRILSLPLWLYRIALRVAALSGRFSYTAEMANRMNQDLSYDCDGAKQDFGFSPQSFLDHPERDLQ